MERPVQPVTAGSKFAVASEAELGGSNQAANPIGQSTDLPAFYHKDNSMRLSMVLWLALVATASGEPVAKITAPTENTPGNLVVIQSKGSSGTALTWEWYAVPEEAGAYCWQAYDKEGNATLFFSYAQPCQMVFMLAVGDVTAEGKAEVAQAYHVLKQGELPPDPDDDDDEPPIPPGPTGLRCLIIYETADKTALPQGQQDVLDSMEVRNYLDAHAGIGNWRFIDDDLSPEQRKHWDKEWNAAYEQALEASNGVRPYLLVTNGKEGVAMPLPDSVAQMMEVLKKYRG